MNDKPEIIAVGIVSMRVCVPKTFTDKKVEDFANTESPTGISSNWQIDRNQVNVRCRCDEREGYEHLVLVC